MAGLNCGTPSYLAWPDLQRGLAGAVVVDDAAAEDAIADLTALGVDSGPCGAASLAALRMLPSRAGAFKARPLSESSVVLLNTEGSDAVRVGEAAFIHHIPATSWSRLPRGLRHGAPCHRIDAPVG